MKRLCLALLTACLVSAAWATADSAPDYLGNGNQLLQQGRLEPAEQAFAAAVKANPRSTEALMKLAGVQLARNDFGAAIRNYQQAIGLDANNAKAFIGLGIAYIHSGNRELTRAALAEALRLEPQRKAQLEPVMAMLAEPADAPARSR